MWYLSNKLCIDACKTYQTNKYTHKKKKKSFVMLHIDHVNAHKIRLKQNKAKEKKQTKTTNIL